MDFAKLVIRFVPKYKWRLISYIILNIISSACGVFSFMAIIPLLQILFGLSQDTLTHTDPSTTSSYSEFLAVTRDNFLFYLQEKIVTEGKVWVLCVVGGLVALMSFLFNIISFFAYWVRIPIRTGISRDLRQEAYIKIVNMPICGFNNENRGDFVSRMTSDIEEIDYGLGTTLDMFVKDPIQIIIYVIAMLGLSPVLTCYSMLLLCVLCFLILMLGRIMERISLKAQANRGKILSAYEQTLGVLPIIKSYCSEYIMSNVFWTINRKTQETFNVQNRFYSLAWPCTNFSIVAIVVVILCVGGKLILLNGYCLDAATFVGFLCVLYSLTTPVDDMMKCTFGIRKAMASLTRLNKILKKPDENNCGTQVLTKGNETNPIIELKNVSYKYDSKQILSNVSFQILKGQKVSIMGFTGSGKTTLANIMSSLFLPNDGEVYLCGHGIGKYELTSVRKNITYVTQDTVLLHESILFNITLGDKNIKFEKVVEAAQKAHIHDFIMTLPNQYETIIGDRGCTLSGGQRQCISLARAFIKDSLIYIFDEVTSAMDSELENDVIRELYTATKEKTVIFITHDIDLTRKSDEVLILDEGKIVESGTPKDLIERDGIYSSLSKMQSQSE